MAGFSEGSAEALVAFSSMVGNFVLGNYGGGLQNAIELFAALDASIQEDFLQSLRDLGSVSGNGAIEDLLNHFANYLKQTANGDQMSLRCAYNCFNCFLITHLESIL